MAEKMHRPKMSPEESKEWKSDLDVCLPIDQASIHNFYQWIGWNRYSLEHRGYDFAAYINLLGEPVLGLPPQTPVKAIADGTVFQSVKKPYGVAYGGFIHIEHGGDYNCGMYSSYHHLVPTIDHGVSVKKGDVIGYLYSDEENKQHKDRIIHLHLELTNPWNKRQYDHENIDPETVFPNIKDFWASPQGCNNFHVYEGKYDPWDGRLVEANLWK